MRGEHIKATDFHDAGAYGRCSYCGRYSDNPTILTQKIKCDCGERYGWSGSFKRPNENSIWSENNNPCCSPQHSGGKVVEMRKDAV